MADKSITKKYNTAFGKLYITVVYGEGDNPIRVMAQIGKSGHEVTAWAESLVNLVNLGLERGLPIEDMVKALSNFRSPYPFFDEETGTMLLSIQDAIAENLGSGNGNRATIQDYGIQATV